MGGEYQNYISTQYIKISCQFSQICMYSKMEEGRRPQIHIPEMQIHYLYGKSTLDHSNMYYEL